MWFSPLDSSEDFMGRGGLRFFGRPFVKRFALCHRSVVLSVCLSVLPVTLVYCGQNGCMDQDATWYRGRPWPRRHCVRWGPSSALPKRGQSFLPNFRPTSIVAKLMDGSTWHMAWRSALVQATWC